MLLTLTHSLIRDSSIRLTHQLWDEIFFLKKEKRKKKHSSCLFHGVKPARLPPPPKVFHTGEMWTGPYVNAEVCLECEDRRSVPGCVEDKLHGVLVHHSCSRTLTFDTLRQRCTEALEGKLCAVEKLRTRPQTSCCFFSELSGLQTSLWGCSDASFILFSWWNFSPYWDA